MIRRKALTITKVGLLVCLAMNKPSLVIGKRDTSILKVCVANSGDRLRWMSRRKALTITKVGLSVCLALNFRKTQFSARFVAYGDTENSVELWR